MNKEQNRIQDSPTLDNNKAKDIIEVTPDLTSIIDDNTLSSEEKVATLSAVMKHEEMYSGPIPPASELQKYESVTNGAADRIIKMAEKQLDHRIDMEKRLVKQGGRGQCFGFILALILLGIGTYALIIGAKTIALIIFACTIIEVLIIFVVGKIRMKDPDEKD